MMGMSPWRTLMDAWQVTPQARAGSGDTTSPVGAALCPKPQLLMIDDTVCSPPR